MGIMRKINRSYLSWVLVIAIMASIFPIVPQRAMAAEPLRLEDATQGSIVSYGGYKWILLDPSTGYVLAQESVNTMRFDEDNTSTFDPDDSNNVAFWLNDETNGFISMLNSADLEWINEHDWTTGPLGGEASNTVDNLKVGLLSESEYHAYKTIPLVLAQYTWWLRTYYNNYQTRLARYATEAFPPFSVVYDTTHYNSNFILHVRPAIYLNPNLFLASGDGSDGTPYVLTDQSTKLSALTTSAGVFIETFAPDTTVYTMNVAYSVTSLTITPTVADSAATVTVNDVPVTSGAPSSAIELKVGLNTIPVEVTAQDGSTKTYELRVTRLLSGSGTQDDPYVIYTADDLSAIRNNLSAHYILEANIDLSGYDYDGTGPDTGGWMPIGFVNDTTSNSFTGTLDGNGYAISNMRIDRPTMSYVGLFGRIDGSAILSDIRLRDIEVVGNDKTGGLVGVLLSGTIEKSYTTGTVRVTGQGTWPFDVAVNAGGLVGLIASSGTIENSYAVVDVSGGPRIGGLAGESNGTIRNAYAAGRVNGAEEIGGLVGYNTGTIENAYTVGNVRGSSDVGGLVGRNDSGGTATNSYWNTNTTGQTGSAVGTGKSSEEMKNAATFGWDSSVWGIREGLTYPYLRAFGMGIGVDPLAETTYSLNPGQDAVSVTGSVYHESAMEPINLHYIIRDSTGNTVTEATYATIDSDAMRSINRRFSLSSYANGSYTLTVMATDSHQTAVGTTLAFTVDSSAAAPPTVHFTNNDEAWTNSISTTVTISDSGGGIDEASLQYVWSTDTVTPRPGSAWTSFDKGEMLTSSATSGEVYLHIRVKDNSGLTANVVSNRFRVEQIAPSISISMSNSDSSEYVNNTWTNQHVTVSQSATDANGVLSNDYSTNGGTTWNPYTGAISLQDDGIHLLSFRAVDGAGNETIVHRTIKISASGLRLTPTMTVLSGSPYTSGTWTNESVTVSVYAEAGLSGIASLTYTLDGGATQGYVSEDPLLISQEGQHSLRFDIADEAGNTLTLPLAVYIDLSDPGVSFTMNGSETLSERASTVVTITDTISGVDTGSLRYAWSEHTTTPLSGWDTLVNGATLSISAANGDRYLHIEASDDAGNTVHVVSNRFRLQVATQQTSVTEVPKTGIDINGMKLDPGSVDLTKSSVTLVLVPKDGIGYVSIPASILTEFAGKNETFIIEIKTPYGSYNIPVNLAALIPGLSEILTKNNLKAEDISFKITLSDKSGDKDIQAAFVNALPNGNVLGAIVDFHIDIINIKTGQPIAAADTFSQALTRVIPIPKDVTIMPAQWGAFRYNESTKKFEFVSANKEQIDGVWYILIRSHTNSVYAVATNPVSFADVQNHWGLPFVQLAASKGLVEGVGAGKYAPDKAVTRAEFTAMLVRALGRGAISLSSDVTLYDDVKQGAWYFEEVSYAKEHGLLGFVSGKSFKPNQPLNREEMASMLAAAIKMEKHPLPDKIASLDGYKDIGSVSPTYMDDLLLIVTHQIMQGTSSSTLDPKGETTRAQAAVVFIRTLQTLGLIDS